MAGDGDDELTSVEHGTLNLGLWEKLKVSFELWNTKTFACIDMRK